MRRLDQILANLGYCSRSEARVFLKTHAVSVAQDPARLINPAQKINPGDVRVDGEPLDHPDGVLLMLHKPLDLVCSHDLREGPNVYSLLPARWRERNPQITSIGRLDKDTSGLLLLTDQTALVHQLTSPKHKVEKIYRATLDKPAPPELAALFGSGTLMLDGEKEPCAPAQLRMLDATTAEVTLTEGRYHQVRRMFASQGCHVLALHRERFGKLTLGNLTPGKFTELPLDYFG